MGTVVPFKLTFASLNLFTNGCEVRTADTAAGLLFSRPGDNTMRTLHCDPSKGHPVICITPFDGFVVKQDGQICVLVAHGIVSELVALGYVEMVMQPEIPLANQYTLRLSPLGMRMVVKKFLDANFNDHMQALVPYIQLAMNQDFIDT